MEELAGQSVNNAICAKFFQAEVGLVWFLSILYMQ